jgi:polo-like kinase 4
MKVTMLEAPHHVFHPPQDEKHSQRAPKHDLPVINTSRLKTIIQNTKHGKLEILPNLSLVVDFPTDPEILLIPSNGLQVSVYDRSNFTGFQCPSSSIPLDILPLKYHKKYRYAFRFVDLVRSKTAKVTRV